MSKETVQTFVDGINKSDAKHEIRSKFLKRIKDGKISLEENPKNHFTVSFVAYDFKKKLVFAGLHKRSELWMFNGGHVEKGESLSDALRREVEEEWGSASFLEKVDKPSLLTVTPVINPGDRECKLHYGVWYFIPVESNEFKPDLQILAKEYTEAGWKTFAEAGKLIIVPNYLLVLEKVSKL